MQGDPRGDGSQCCDSHDGNVYHLVGCGCSGNGFCGLVGGQYTGGCVEDAGDIKTMNLTGQRAKADALRPQFAAFRVEMEKRFEVWQRMTPARRRKWIQAAAEKDPLFDLFIGIVQYSRKWEINDDD